MVTQKQILKKEMKLPTIQKFKLSLWDYNDACILVRGNITVTANSQTRVAFINCAPFNWNNNCAPFNWDNNSDAENLNLVMSRYNLIEL